MDNREQIRLLLNRINASWLSKSPEDLPPILNECFAEDMVIRGCAFEALARGREACVRSYVDFIRQATVRDCRLSEPDIDQWGDTALATYSWEIGYSLEGVDYQDSGHDAFLLKREGDKWLAVWRAMLPKATPAVPPAA